MTLSLIKILGSLLLLISILAGMQKLGKALKVHAEVQRKIIHTGLGLYSLTFPLIFLQSWEVTTLCGAAIVILSLIRSVPALKERLGSGLHSVDRLSLGEIFFAFSIGLLFYLSEGNAVLYILPMLILTLSDAAAALVGTGYAKSFFTVEEGKKSWEGTAFFFLTAWLLSMITLLLLSDIPREAVISAALIVALFGALIEAVSWKGLDNLFVPIGLFLLLQKLAFLPPIELAGISASFLAVLALSAWLAKKLQFDVHAVNTIITASFFFWIVGEWVNLPAPLAVFATYLYLQRKNDLNDDLPVVLSIISTALFWYVISMVFEYNTYYVYNLSFGLHLVMLVLLQKNMRKFIPFITVIALSWMVTNVRILFASDFSAYDLQLSAGALALLFLAACVTLKSHNFFENHRWTKQALAVLAFSSLGVPLTLWL